MAAAYGTAPKLSALERLVPLTSLDISQTSAGSYHGCAYTVLNGNEVLFNLMEDSASTGFFAGGSHRAFHMDGVDDTGAQVFSLRRPLMFSSDKLELYLYDSLMSVIRLTPTFMTPMFSINDAQDIPVLRIKGKISETSHFRLQTTAKKDIGTIDKKWLGWGRELTSRRNDYIITFPADLATHFKVAVIAACVFIDFRFFEGK